MASVDACGVVLEVGDIVMFARTGKSAGISWSRLTITRLTERSMWWYGKRSSWSSKETENGPHPLRNCVKVGTTRNGPEV